jgi:hypothetical protein
VGLGAAQLLWRHERAHSRASCPQRLPRPAHLRLFPYPRTLSEHPLLYPRATLSTPSPSLSVSTLGYTTDNGAQLCFGCQGPLDACLLEEKAYLDKIGVPLGYLSFQNDWWQSTDESAPWCVGEWVAPPRKVPMGMQAFQQALGLPLQLYAPYFCDTSDYAKNFSMVKSDTTLPGCGDASTHCESHEPSPPTHLTL